MPKVRELVSRFTQLVPPEMKMDFDNVGLLVGTNETPVTKALVALDITDEVIDEAIAAGATILGENKVQEAEGKIASMVNEHEITRKAYEQANEIVAAAQKNAREIRLGTKEYADNILNKVEEILTDTLAVIKANREELR